ncbi:MAG: relaxase domain-containing protein [Phycisphaerae bacterium]|nr:relaxase domain-containing protein [Phycisphaerae bacterium]
MLSIAAMKAGQGNYYLNLAREDYYLEGGEPPGRCLGRGADLLGLSGRVERPDLQKLLDGFRPDGTKLTQNAGDENRQPGWDLTFSVPKSVSVLWSQADIQTRRQIQQAAAAAVEAALDYLESEASFTRRGKGGLDYERASLGAAVFEHGTSRAGDPNLHFHFLVMNGCVREDGTTGALFSRALYQHKMVTGAIFRAELAHRLQRLGLECERKSTWFEISGVSKKLCDHFSKRRKEIEQEVGPAALETASAEAFAEATLKTRQVKRIVPPRKELFRFWRKEGEEYGLTEKQVTALLGNAVEQDPEREFRRAFNVAVEVITDQQSHFSEKELLLHTAVATLGRGCDTRILRGRVKHEIEHSPNIVKLGEHKHEMQYTTADMLSVEKHLLECADRTRSDKSHVVSPKLVDSVIARRSAKRSRTKEELTSRLKHAGTQLVRVVAKKKTFRFKPDRRTLRKNAEFTLNPEQVKAVQHLTQTPGAVKVLSGVAGTGKTATLNVCREVWEKAGCTVIGAALAGKAVRQLERGSGINSDTLAMLELRMNPSLKHQLKHHGKQLLRAARKKRTYKLERLRINKKTVLVIDEASMVGTRQLARVAERVVNQGGKVVMAGDARQLSALEAGCPFLALAKRLDCAELVEVSRQDDERDRQVVRDLAKGETERALKNLAQRGLVSVESTRERAIDTLVSDWSEAAARRTDETLIFCGTNREADKVNHRCQSGRINSGHVDTSTGLKLKDDYVFQGDRILFTKRDIMLGVENGETGTVIAVNGFRKAVAVQVDGGARVIIPLKRYRHDHGDHKGDVALRLGYAVTTHKGQGTTVDRAYVLAGGSMQDREISYVQASRARTETRIYIDEREAGEDLARLARQMKRSQAKDLAHDVIRKQEPGFGLELG